MIIFLIFYVLQKFIVKLFMHLKTRVMRFVLKIEFSTLTETDVKDTYYIDQHDIYKKGDRI